MTTLLALDFTFLSDTWSFVEANWDELARGLRRTIQVSAIAITGAFAIGLVLGAARAHRIPVVSQLAAIYVEVIRNTPILVQIFFLYYGLPAGRPLPRRIHRRLALSDDLGRRVQHRELPRRLRGRPDRSRGRLCARLQPVANFLNVTLPIGGRIALPSSINTYISVVKNTSLMYVISYQELTTTVLQIQALTLETVEAFTVLALTYLILVWTMSALIRLLESHLALPKAFDEHPGLDRARPSATCSRRAWRTP